jgi:hypothetical protein
VSDKERYDINPMPGDFWNVSDGRHVVSETWTKKEHAARSAAWMNEKHNAGEAHGNCQLATGCDFDRIVQPDKARANAFVLCAEHRGRVGRS